MMWIAKTDRFPKLEDWDRKGKILIWDENNGCLIGKQEKLRDILREFVTHWQHVPKEWIKKEERYPNVFDADPQGCILALDEFNGACIMGWNNPTLLTDRIVGWQRLPEGPRDVR